MLPVQVDFSIHLWFTYVISLKYPESLQIVHIIAAAIPEQVSQCAIPPVTEASSHILHEPTKSVSSDKNLLPVQVDFNIHLWFVSVISLTYPVVVHLVHLLVVPSSWQVAHPDIALIPALQRSQVPI